MSPVGTMRDNNALRGGESGSYLAGGIPRSLQIFFTRLSTISAWRGIAYRYSGLDYATRSALLAVARTRDRARPAATPIVS